MNVVTKMILHDPQRCPAYEKNVKSWYETKIWNQELHRMWQSKSFQVGVQKHEQKSDQRCHQGEVTEQFITSAKMLRKYAPNESNAVRSKISISTAWNQ